MAAHGKRDAWDVGEGYDAYIGRWSAEVARELVRWLALPPRRRWLDVGSGTGALAGAILAAGAPAEVIGVDRSAGFLAAAKSRAPRAAFGIADACALPVAGGAFDAVVSGLVLNFVSDPAAMVAEMARAARPGGTVALYVWDYAGGMELIRRFWDAAVAVDAGAVARDEAVRFPVCAPAALEALFQAAGLRRIEGRPIAVPTRFRDFDELWAPFLAGQGPAPSYVTSLPEPRRAAVRDAFRASLAAAPDGSLSLSARAWAVRGLA